MLNYGHVKTPDFESGVVAIIYIRKTSIIIISLSGTSNLRIAHVIYSYNYWCVDVFPGTSQLIVWWTHL